MKNNFFVNERFVDLFVCRFALHQLRKQSTRPISNPRKFVCMAKGLKKYSYSCVCDACSERTRHEIREREKKKRLILSTFSQTCHITRLRSLQSPHFFFLSTSLLFHFDGLWWWWCSVETCAPRINGHIISLSWECGKCQNCWCQAVMSVSASCACTVADMMCDTCWHVPPEHPTFLPSTLRCRPLPSPSTAYIFISQMPRHLVDADSFSDKI